MTDLHFHIRGLLARQRQRDLDDQDVPDPTSDTASAGRLGDVERTAGRTRANVAAAAARRRYARLAHGR